MDALALPAPSTHATLDARLRAAVDAHYDVLWRFLRRMGVGEAAVEDAVQQVLLVFVRRADSVPPDRERSFLLGTALRVAADFRKRTARQREVVTDDVGRELADAACDPESDIDERRARRLLDVSLARLPDVLRSVLVMCDIEELTMAEVAASLALAPGTVASRLRRARVMFHDEVQRARREGFEGDRDE